MSPPPTPDPGTNITFLNTDPTCLDVFRRGVAAGPAVHDPDTDQDWIPVVCPDRSRLLVHAELVVARGTDPTALPPHNAGIQQALDVVRQAATRATGSLARLAGSPCPPWDEVATVLEEFLTELSPMRGTMRALTQVNPSGELTDVVNCLADAAWHLNAGDIRATRAAVAAGATALDRYRAAG